MLPSRENCPVCNKQLQHIKRLNKPCVLINKPSLSYVESVCNTSNSPDAVGHHYFQISSLYSELLYEKVGIYDINSEVSLVYPSHKTVVRLWPQPFSNQQSEQIEFPNIWKLDYPKLEKISEKIKVIKAFL